MGKRERMQRPDPRAPLNPQREEVPSATDGTFERERMDIPVEVAAMHESGTALLCARLQVFPVFAAPDLLQAHNVPPRWPTRSRVNSTRVVCRMSRLCVEASFPSGRWRDRLQRGGFTDTGVLRGCGRCWRARRRRVWLANVLCNSAYALLPEPGDVFQAPGSAHASLPTSARGIRLGASGFAELSMRTRR